MTDPVERLCVKPICHRPARFSVTCDWAQRVVAIGPLSPFMDLDSYDLCYLHAKRLSMPAGWQILRHRLLD